MTAPAPPHDYLKFYITEENDVTVARVYAGETREAAVYSGTLVLESVLFERFMDAITYGVRDVYHGDFEVYAGPDERGVE
jgi:hypothetical protein